jgi:hypothetical protein
MKKFLFLPLLLMTFLASAQIQYVSYPYKLYKIGFKAPTGFKTDKNTTTEFAISSTERGLNFRLRPVKEDASVDITDAVELAKIAMVEVNSTYSNVTTTEDSPAILSTGLSGHYIAGSATDGSVKINFFAMGIFNSSNTMQFYGIGSYPVNRSSASNYDICKRILQSMQVIP